MNDIIEAGNLSGYDFASRSENLSTEGIRRGTGPSLGHLAYVKSIGTEVKAIRPGNRAAAVRDLCALKVALIR